MPHDERPNDDSTEPDWILRLREFMRRASFILCILFTCAIPLAFAYHITWPSDRYPMRDIIGCLVWAWVFGLIAYTTPRPAQRPFN